MANEEQSELQTGNQWYILYPCYNSEQPVIFTQVTEFNSYLNTTVEVLDVVASDYLGCFTVKLFSSTPLAFATVNNNVVVDGTDCTPCDAFCFSIGGGTGTVTYINYNDVETTTSLPAKICTKTKPYVSISTPIIKPAGGECFSITGCDISCFELTNCDTGQIIYSNNQSLFSAYANNNTITLNELDGCWTVDLGVECECLEDVSIALSYSSCETCLPILAFKLTNCENESLVKYSQEDLTEYDGKVVFLDCGDCWFLERIDHQPPSIQEFVIEFTYDTCIECGRAYFILFDCAGELEPITTYTDLTEDYTANNIIKLASYPSCWSIQTAPTPDFANAVEVVVSSRYEECAECLAVVGCKCTKVKNTTAETLTYTYKDCNEIEKSFSLVSGATSPKFCLNQWILVHLTTDIITESGDCVEDPNDAENKICPADPTGRMVKPGYNIPGCDIEKFERITCQTAEVLYKQVLQQRYGISNCCPDEDENLILKKEVIDLQLLNDPDYPCASPSQCCASAQCSCGNCIS
jgi:hypothetical protein